MYLTNKHFSRFEIENSSEKQYTEDGKPYLVTSKLTIKNLQAVFGGTYTCRYASTYQFMNHSEQKKDQMANILDHSMATANLKKS